MKLTRFGLLLACLIIFISPIINPSYSAVETVVFDDLKTEQRYKSLIAELRCLVCQNQSIADSDADLAKDLRRKTAEMLRAGESDRHIRNYMRERYGDFVLYKPPFEGLTAALWLTPVGLLILLVIGIIITIKRRQDNALLKPNHVNDEMQRIKVRNLLRDTPELDDREPN